MPSLHRRISMSTYDVTLLVAGVDEEGLDGIYAATDGAATVEIGDRWTSTVGFDIEAGTFADAVLQAIDQIEQVPGLNVVRVEPDQLVWASEIADRVGRARQSIDQLVIPEGATLVKGCSSKRSSISPPPEGIST